MCESSVSPQEHSPAAFSCSLASAVSSICLSFMQIRFLTQPQRELVSLSRTKPTTFCLTSRCTNHTT